MEVTLSADIERRVEQELASGKYHSVSELMAEAVRFFLEENVRSQRRMEAVRRIGRAVDEAGLYEGVAVAEKE